MLDGLQTLTVVLSQSPRQTYETASNQLVCSFTTAFHVYSVTETYRFTGKPYSSATGLYYNYQRWYDPSVGRFISQDPILGSVSYPQTLNRYTYTINNPVQYVDPTGELPIIPIILVAAFFLGLGAAATLSPELASYTDPAMTFVGMIPVLGDFTSDPYFAARDISSCALGRGCDQFQTGLDIAVLLPVVPGALARGKRIANLVDATADLTRTTNRGDNLLDVLRTADRTGITETHHLLPQAKEFRRFFKQAGLNINDYTIGLDRNIHKIIHGKTIGLSSGWNNQWRAFFKGNPTATADDILEHMDRLKARFYLP